MTRNDWLGRLRLISSAVHGLVGVVAALVGLAALGSAVMGGGLALTGGSQPLWIDVCLSIIVLLPGGLVAVSARPMALEQPRAFRSAAAAGFVLGVASVGIWALFDGVVARILAIVLGCDFVVLGLFAWARESRRGPSGIA